jgi:hypothetical protein
MRLTAVRSLAILSVLLLTTVISTSAQQLSLAGQVMLPNRAYEGRDIDSISAVNGSLRLHIPLLPYLQRGTLSASFSLLL